MHPRGRSHDLSPLAVTVPAHDGLDPHSMSLAVGLDTHNDPPRDLAALARAYHPSRPIHYTHTPQPVASSSRTDPSPPFR